jgi:hypothetical protein
MERIFVKMLRKRGSATGAVYRVSKPPPIHYWAEDHQIVCLVEKASQPVFYGETT